MGFESATLILWQFCKCVTKSWKLETIVIAQVGDDWLKTEVISSSVWTFDVFLTDAALGANGTFYGCLHWPICPQLSLQTENTALQQILS